MARASFILPAPHGVQTQPQDMPSDDIVVWGTAMFSLVVILLIFSWITVALRLWVRVGITRSPGWDDATMLFTLCLFTCYCTFILVITITSKENKDFSVIQLLRLLIYVQLSEIFYILTTTFLKISLGLFFLRLLTKPWQVRLFQIILATSAVYGLFYFFATVFVCGSPTRIQDAFLNPKTCSPTWFILSTGYIYGVINVIADWTFTLIPIIILLDSDMDRQSKISVSIVMGFAAIGSVSSILRMVYLEGLLFGHSVSITSIKATVWATAEPGTGIIAASAAILRPLFRKLATDVRGKISEYGTGRSAGSHSTGKDTQGTDRESVIGLTTVSTNDSYASRQMPHSPDAHDPWDHRTSTERAHIELGRAVVVHIGGELRPVPPPKS